jgi:hypothetical protein
MKERIMRRTVGSFNLEKTALLALTILTVMGFTIQPVDAYDGYAYNEHGLKAQIQTPANVLNITRIGWGTVLTGKPNTGTWVHIPISAHWYVGDGKIPTIYTVLLYFNSEFGYPTIKKVYLTENRGDIRLKLDGLSIRGNYLTTPKSFNVPEFNPSGPLCLSFFVNFGPAVNAQNPRFHILGAWISGDLD